MTAAMWAAFAAGAILGATVGLVGLSVVAARRISEAFNRGHDVGVRRMTEVLDAALVPVPDELRRHG